MPSGGHWLGKMGQGRNTDSNCDSHDCGNHDFGDDDDDGAWD